MRDGWESAGQKWEIGGRQWKKGRSAGREGRGGGGWKQVAFSSQTSFGKLATIGDQFESSHTSDTVMERLILFPSPNLETVERIYFKLL